VPPVTPQRDSKHPSPNHCRSEAKLQWLMPPRSRLDLDIKTKATFVGFAFRNDNG
jgi:hypothetical protein